MRHPGSVDVEARDLSPVVDLERRRHLGAGNAEVHEPSPLRAQEAGGREAFGVVVEADDLPAVVDVDVLVERVAVLPVGRILDLGVTAPPVFEQEVADDPVAALVGADDLPAVVDARGAVPAWPLGTAGTIVASGWSIGLKTPPFARKPWLVVPAAAGGGSADTGAAASASVTASSAAAASAAEMTISLCMEASQGLLTSVPRISGTAGSGLACRARGDCVEPFYAERAGHCCILGSCVGSAYMGGQP